MEKEELNDLITSVAKFLRNDANTYLWAKSQRNFLTDSQNYKDSDYELGGGNFFIALSAFSCLSLLAKIYKIIEDQESNSREKREYINETNAVKEFVKKVNGEIKIVDDPSTEEYWRLLRHGLVHFFFPKGNSSISAVSSTDFYAGMSLFQYVQYLKGTKEPAITKNKNNKGFICNADLLAVRVYQTAHWLIGYIDKMELNYNVKKALDNLFDIKGQTDLNTI